MGTAARARGMQEIARGTGTTRAGLYKALCERGNPEFGTVLRVLQALGLRLRLGARGGKGARAPARAAVRAGQRKIGA